MRARASVVRRHRRCVPHRGVLLLGRVARLERQLQHVVVDDRTLHVIGQVVERRIVRNTWAERNLERAHAARVRTAERAAVVDAAVNNEPTRIIVTASETEAARARWHSGARVYKHGRWALDHGRTANVDEPLRRPNGQPHIRARLLLQLDLQRSERAVFVDRGDDLSSRWHVVLRHDEPAGLIILIPSGAVPLVQPRERCVQ